MSPEFEPSIRVIMPSTLLNQKRLFTTQNWIDLPKLTGAFHAQTNATSQSASGWVFTNKKGEECYVLGDGNHKTALAILKRETITFVPKGLWVPQMGKHFGFGIIMSKVKPLL